MRTERFLPFILSIDRISKNIKRIKDIFMEQYQLRSAHVICLFNLVKYPEGLSLTEIADVCGVDKAFVSRVTDELSKKEYISRDKNSRGSIYKSKFVLTEQGKEISNFISKKIEKVMEDVGGEIPEHKLKIFYEVLGILDENISFELKEEKYGK